MKLIIGKDKKIGLERLYRDKDWKKFKDDLIIPVGADSPTNNLIISLRGRFNILIGGEAGSGKSTFLHAAIVNLLRSNRLDDFKLLLVDTKQTEFGVFSQLSNLFAPVAQTPEEAKDILWQCAQEVSSRFKSILGNNLKSVEQYNSMFQFKMPRIVIVIDEFSDLMFHDSNFFEGVFAQMAKVGGMAHVHLIIATSRPLREYVYRRKIVNGFPYRLAFKTQDAKDSKTIIGFAGAEQLKKKGEMLAMFPNYKKPHRAQGFFVTREEIEKTVAQIKQLSINPTGTKEGEKK